MRRLVAAVLASAVLVALLVVLTDLHEDPGRLALGETFAALSWPHAALAGALYAVSYLGRAARLALLLPGAGGLVALASVCARHNLLNLVLPLRSGEAALPMMLKVEHGRSLAEGASALLVARVLDLLSVALYAVLGVTLAGRAETPLLPRVLLVVAVCAVALAALRPIALAAARRLSGDGRVGGFLRRAAGHLAELSRGRLLGCAVVSLATWGLTYGACFVLIVAMRGDAGAGPALSGVTFTQSLIGSTGLHLAGILPLNTVAGVGAWEAGWTAGYTLAGLDEAAALTSAVVSHALILGFVATLGGLGFAFRRRAA